MRRTIGSTSSSRVNASALDNGSWTDVNSLDLTSPNDTGAGALNGNAAANRNVKGPIAIIPSSPIPPDQLFFIRWVPLAISGAEDGLSVDDFAIRVNQPDGDADGRADSVDNCVTVSNQDQTDSDGDGAGDACDPVDRDGDGVLDADDNCPSVVNADQANGDGDGRQRLRPPCPRDSAGRDGCARRDGSRRHRSRRPRRRKRRSGRKN